MDIHLQEFHLEVEIMPNKLPCVFHWCYVTSFRLVVGEECYLPGNIVHTKLRPDPPPSDHGDYAAIYQALYTTHDLVREQHSLATLRKTWNLHNHLKKLYSMSKFTHFLSILLARFSHFIKKKLLRTLCVSRLIIFSKNLLRMLWSFNILRCLQYSHAFLAILYTT